MSYAELQVSERLKLWGALGYGTVFFTIEDETGDLQSIIRPHVFAQCGRALSNQLILLDGCIDRWDGTTNIVAERIIAIGADIHLPDAHDWH